MVADGRTARWCSSCVSAAAVEFGKSGIAVPSAEKLPACPDRGQHNKHVAITWTLCSVATRDATGSQPNGKLLFVEVKFLSGHSGVYELTSKSALQLHMASDRVLINVFLLGVVDPHQGLDQLDHTLRISDEVSIGIFGREAGLKLSQKTRQMDDLAMRSTHRTQAVTVGEELGEFWINLGFVVSLMFDDLSRNDLVCL